MSIELNMGLAMYMILSWVVIISMALIFKSMGSFDYILLEKFIVIGFFLIVGVFCVYCFTTFAPPTIPWMTVIVNAGGMIFLVIFFWKRLREEA